MPKHPAVFLDRDGTIIEDVGYINRQSQVAFYPFSINSLKKLQEQYLLFIITNQSGISKGHTTEKDVLTVNKYIEDCLSLHNISILETYYCPHSTKDMCHCKKPSPFFINQATMHYDIDLSKSFIIGDHPSDAECGINAGITPIYILSGHGEKHQDELREEVYVCANIMEAIEFILST